MKESPLDLAVMEECQSNPKQSEVRKDARLMIGYYKNIAFVTKCNCPHHDNKIA